MPPPMTTTAGFATGGAWYCGRRMLACMSMRLGIVGCGTIGNVHANAAARAGVEIVGAWDVHPSRSQQLCSKHSGRACDGLDQLLAMPELDAVIVAVPNHLHAPIAIQCLDAKKHTLLEKPMAMSVAECRTIRTAAERAQRVLQLGFVCRGSPAAQTTKHFIDRGRFGTITHIKCASYRRRGVPGLGGWFTTKALSGGGALIDLGVHLLDLSLFLAGSPQPQRASGKVFTGIGSRMRDYVYTAMWAGPPQYDGVCDVEDGATALIRCTGGLTIEMDVFWAANLPDGHLRDGLTILGDAGGAHFQIYGKDVRIATEEEGRLVDLTPHFACEDPDRDMWDAQLAQFRAAVERGIAPHADAAAGLRVQSVVDAIYASHEADREVDIAPIA